MKHPPAALFILLAGCATPGSHPDVPDWVATECSPEAFAALKREIQLADEVFDIAADEARRVPTEENEANAAAAAADVAMAHADVEARRVDCSQWR